MGWFNKRKEKKNLGFSSELSENNVRANMESRQFREVYERKYVKCTGVDFNVLDRIYFSSEEEKEDLVKQVKAKIVSQKIVEKLEYQEFIKRRGYSPSDGELNPFLFFILIEIEEITETATTNGVCINKKTDCKKQSFEDKVNGFYDVINFNIYNLKQKVKSETVTFEEEVELIMDTINSEIQNQRFIQLSGLFEIGKAYLSRNEEDKSLKYFNLLLDLKYRVSDYSVSSFCKAVGNLYEEREDFELAIQWYQKGIELNSKLSVKRKIIALRKKL